MHRKEDARIVGSAFVAAAAALIAACGAGDDTAQAVGGESGTGWEAFVEGAVAGYYSRNPETAVSAGLHDYDGMMSDYSAPALEAYVAWLDDTLAGAQAFEGLSTGDAFERDYLVAALRARLFPLRDAREPDSSPLFYVPRAGVYVEREYASPEKRIVAYTRYVGQIPERMAAMRENLDLPLSAPLAEIGYGVFDGLASYLETTVPGLFDDVRDDALRRQFAAANDTAVASLKQSVAWLAEQRETATADFALGEDLFLKMLRETEGVRITLPELVAAGETDLARNLETLEEACAEYAPELDTRGCVLKMQNRKPPDGPVAGAARQLPELKQFLVDQALVSIPGAEEARVAEAPPHERFNTAYIDIPGPFESRLPSVYYIAPPDPAWSEEDRRAYIPGEADLLSISVHEVWPGHFLQYLHANRAANRIGRHFGTYSFGEGWGHYVEQMVLDAGLGNGDPEVHIGQIVNALKRNVRYLSAIGLHTGGMTVEQSQAMFREKAFFDVGNASQQALRGAYDPGYLNYTLGKLMINKLRDDWTANRGGREAWGEFHDAFLSYGSPPIPLVRRMMLGPDYSGDEALLPAAP